MYNIFLINIMTLVLFNYYYIICTVVNQKVNKLLAKIENDLDVML